MYTLIDEARQPVAFTLTIGQPHDLVGVGALLVKVPAARRPIADRVCDARKSCGWLARCG
ncbi:MAG: hypothetical protein OXD40_15905 [bacterium]|nr:hypothetical protein [bacterium]